MTEFMQIIAETEGVRTPTKKRSRADVQKAYDAHVAKKAAKKKPSAAKPKTAAKAPAAKQTPATKVTKVAPATAEPIDMCFVSETGYVREVGYDPKSKLFYVGFAKSAWAMPSSKTEWDGVEKAIADPDVNFDTYYRATFRGRTADMLPVRKAVSK